MLAPVTTAQAKDLTVATFNAELSRDGPGLLYRDIADGTDAQIAAAIRVIAAADPDLLLLTGFDWDLDGLALGAFAGRLADAGAAYPHRLSLRPNTGLATERDMDGDGRLNEPEDAQGWGRFPGAGGMAVLSRLPLDTAGLRDFSGFLWRDLPGALIEADTLPAEARDHQRLSTTGHWDVPVILPDGQRLHLLAASAAPPVFDGPEDRNGRRNHDETAFWTHYLDGNLPWPAPAGSPVILGTLNLDPTDGDGRPAALAALLSDPRLTDPGQAGAGGAAAADPGQNGDPARDTAAFPPPKGPGNLRVDYVLPAASLPVIASGVWWPAPGDPGADDAAAASRHRLVWVRLAIP